MRTCDWSQLPAFRIVPMVFTTPDTCEGIIRSVDISLEFYSAPRRPGCALAALIRNRVAAAVGVGASWRSQHSRDDSECSGLGFA